MNFSPIEYLGEKDTKRHPWERKELRVVKYLNLLGIPSCRSVGSLARIYSADTNGNHNFSSISDSTDM